MWLCPPLDIFLAKFSWPVYCMFHFIDLKWFQPQQCISSYIHRSTQLFYGHMSQKDWAPGIYRSTSLYGLFSSCVFRYRQVTWIQLNRMWRQRERPSPCPDFGSPRLSLGRHMGWFALKWATPGDPRKIRPIIACECSTLFVKAFQKTTLNKSSPVVHKRRTKEQTVILAQRHVIQLPKWQKINK